jgi:hypothetical protein
MYFYEFALTDLKLRHEVIVSELGQRLIVDKQWRSNGVVEVKQNVLAQRVVLVEPVAPADDVTVQAEHHVDRSELEVIVRAQSSSSSIRVQDRLQGLRVQCGWHLALNIVPLEFLEHWCRLKMFQHGRVLLLVIEVLLALIGYEVGLHDVVVSRFLVAKKVDQEVVVRVRSQHAPIEVELVQVHRDANRGLLEFFFVLEGDLAAGNIELAHTAQQCKQVHLEVAGVPSSLC